MSGFMDVMRERLAYMLSLPERTIRSLASVAGGTTSLLTDTLFPESLRGTTMYRIFVGDAQRFVLEKVAQVQRDTPVTDAAPADDPSFVQRKMIGGAFETAGLFAMHFSPLWVFAFASDAASGGGVFLQRLVERLKRNGVIPKHTEIHGVTDLLVAIQDASRQSAAAVDTPPLSREELSRLAADMTARYRELFSKAANLLPRLETIWQRMHQIAEREKVSVDRLVGILTVDVASWARKGIGAVLSVGQTTNDLFGEQVLDSYSKTLDAINEEGMGSYMTRRMKPFIQKAAEHFDPARKTWTEGFLSRLERDDAVEVRDPKDAPGANWPATDVVEKPDDAPPTGCGPSCG